MSHYKSNLRDIQFNLFEVLRRQDLLGQAPYDELDEETVRGILAELERLATGPLAESFAEAVSRDRFFFVADFNIDTLARLIANTTIPGAETRIV